jgi:uncharacterized protein (DUF1800 family)
MVLLATLATLSLACLTALSAAKKKPPVISQMNQQKRALHALQRLTFGPRPGDVDRVAAIGVDKWIDLQLHPDKIDDSALDARLAPFRTLHMDTREIVENFPNEQMIKAVMDGKRPMPSDPIKRAVYQAQIERLQERNERKQEAAAASPVPTATNASVDQATGDSAASTNDNPSARTGKLGDEQEAQRREDRLYADLKAQELLDKPADERMKEVLQMSPEEQRALSMSLKGPKADEFMEGMNPKQKETLQALKNPQQVVGDELMQAKLLRAIYSERQLDEVMTDFWFNHFNVFLGKGADRFLVTSYERDVIRPHALGKFEDLLVATAKSPAMMFYLDNWLSVGPESDIALGVRRNPNYYGRRRFPPPPRQVKGKGKRNAGLNENYGRELMELHTLGVNGGYTQTDVTEVARVLTGWTIDQPQRGGGFKFEERMHEPGTKIVLGHKIKQHGEKEGMEVLHLLAHHPSTAHFICTKLAMRFVSDDPPPALVERMARTFTKTDGDLRAVLETMFTSREFISEGAWQSKVKSPLEMVASAVRALGAEVTDTFALAQKVAEMGEPLYGKEPPTGFKDVADTWLSTSNVMARIEFAGALAEGRIAGVKVDLARWSGNGPSTMARALLDRDPTEQTVAAIEKAGAASPTVVAAVVLSSPEFQRR